MNAHYIEIFPETSWEVMALEVEIVGLLECSCESVEISQSMKKFKA